MQCTRYCIKRWNEVNEIELPALRQLGDACNWIDYSFKHPLSTTDTIMKNGVACFSGGEKGQGHVIFIEKVYSDGSFEYSEANCTVHTEGETYYASNVKNYINKHKIKNHEEWDFKYQGCIYIKGAPNVGA